MAGIQADLPFYPLNIAVLTVSDTRDETTDTSGALLAERLQTAGHVLAGKAIVKVPEVGGRGGLDPVRYGDWEKNGRCIDF